MHDEVAVYESIIPGSNIITYKKQLNSLFHFSYVEAAIPRHVHFIDTHSFVSSLLDVSYLRALRHLSQASFI